MREIAVVVANLVRHHPVSGVQEQEVALHPRLLVEIAAVEDPHCCVETQTVSGVRAVQGHLGLAPLLRGDLHRGAAGGGDVGTGGQQVRGLNPVRPIEGQPGVGTVHTGGGHLISQASGRVANMELGVDPLLFLGGIEDKVVTTVLPSHSNISITQNILSFTTMNDLC